MVAKKQSTKTAQLYAYSFDRETWQGDFNSREEAMQAAMNDEHNKGCLVAVKVICKLHFLQIAISVASPLRIVFAQLPTI